jgi:hypothetical protein
MLMHQVLDRLRERLHERRTRAHQVRAGHVVNRNIRPNADVSMDGAGGKSGVVIISRLIAAATARAG